MVRYSAVGGVLPRDEPPFLDTGWLHHAHWPLRTPMTVTIAIDVARTTIVLTIDDFAFFADEFEVNDLASLQ